MHGFDREALHLSFIGWFEKGYLRRQDIEVAHDRKDEQWYNGKKENNNQERNSVPISCCIL